MFCLAAYDATLITFRSQPSREAIAGREQSNVRNGQTAAAFGKRNVVIEVKVFR